MNMEFSINSEKLTTSYVENKTYLKFNTRLVFTNLTRQWTPLSFNVLNSGAAKLLYDSNCAFYEESMKLLSLLAHTIRFIFRCGGKVESTSESRHLGFFKMAAVKIFFFVNKSAST